MDRKASEALDSHITGNYGYQDDSIEPLFSVQCVIGEAWPTTGTGPSPTIVALTMIAEHANDRGGRYTFPGENGGHWEITAPFVRGELE